jgi:hypothetical protein
MKVISHTFGALLRENYAALKIAFSHGILTQQGLVQEACTHEEEREYHESLI